MIPAHTSRLDRVHRTALILVSILLAATGLVWMALYWSAMAWPDLDGHGLRSALHQIVTLHGITAYLAAIFVGSLLGRHVPAGLKQRRRLASGLTGLGLIGLLILSALFLYYASTPDLRDIASLVHQACGLLATGAVGYHMIRRGHHKRAEKNGAAKVT